MRSPEKRIEEMTTDEAIAYMKELSDARWKNLSKHTDKNAGTVTVGIAPMRNRHSVSLPNPGFGW